MGWAPTPRHSGTPVLSRSSSPSCLTLLFTYAAGSVPSSRLDKAPGGEGPVLLFSSISHNTVLGAWQTHELNTC